MTDDNDIYIHYMNGRTGSDHSVLVSTMTEDEVQQQHADLYVYLMGRGKDPVLAAVVKKMGCCTDEQIASAQQWEDTYETK
jgi:hypothetical protein